MPFTDQMGRGVYLKQWPPQRIVSLVPSQTELLYDLGLGDRVVGITKFCVHPEKWYRSKMRIGGTKTPDFKRIRKLEPDLIIGNKEENTKAGIEQLEKDYPVWLSNVTDLNSALNMMKKVGELTHTLPRAEALARKIAAAFHAFRLPEHYAQKRVAYFIWKDPWMTAGPETFIHALLEHCGFVNAIQNARYPEVRLPALARAKPDLILLSSEPYPFREMHIPPIRAVCPKAQIRMVDGEYFSWFGSRLAGTPDYMRSVFSS